VAEVFGTAGEAKSDPRYRFGVRWESKKLVIAATYSDAFDGSGGAGFEIGFIYFTEPRFCFGVLPAPGTPPSCPALGCVGSTALPHAL